MANINDEVLTNYMFLVLGIIALIPSIVGILAYKNCIGATVLIKILWMASFPKDFMLFFLDIFPK